MTPRLRESPGASGSVLVEFALVALILYLLLAATIAFGRTIQGSQVAQSVAETCARELALEPLPPGLGLFESLTYAPPGEPGFLPLQQRLYNPNWLAIDLDEIPQGVSLDAFVADLPLINRALRPAMIFDRFEFEGRTRRFLRVPGALLGARPEFDPGHGFTVGVPVVVGRSDDGVETIEWQSVIQEITPGAFAFQPAAPATTGLAAIRVQIPVQAGGLSGFRRDPNDPSDGSPNPNVRFVIEADDAAVTSVNSPPGTLLALPSDGFGTYRGPFGLGRQAALGTNVRPFRRVMIGQAIARRETFR